MNSPIREEAERLVDQTILEAGDEKEVQETLEDIRDDLVLEAESMLLEEAQEEAQEELVDVPLEPSTETNSRQTVQKELLEKGSNKVRLSKIRHTKSNMAVVQKPYVRNTFILNQDKEVNKNNATINTGSAGPRSS